MANPTWLTVLPDTDPKWEAVKVVYIGPDDPLNNHSVNIYIKTLDKNGNYQSGVRVWQAWPDGKAEALTRPEGELDFNGEPFGYSFPMSEHSSFSPDRGEHGPYSCYVETGETDIVQGMGLPLKHHVQFLLTFQWVENGPIPPPARREWVVTEQSKHRIVTEKVRVS